MVGLAAAPILTTQIAAHFGWRWAFFVAGVPGVILGLLIAGFVAEPKRQANNPASLAGPTRPASIGDYFSILRYRNMLLSCVAAAGNLTGLFLVSVFGPLYLTQVANEAPTTAGFILGAFGLGAFFGGFILPGISNRIGRKTMLLINAVTTGLIPVVLLVPSLYDDLWLMALLLFLFNGGQSIAALAHVIIPTETIPRAVAATGIGLAAMFAELISATVGPAVGITLGKTFGLPATMWAAAGALVVVLIAALFMRETKQSGVATAGVAASP